ncbi:bifunctional Polyribonucleotide 5-hydroxyl-kinase Clp1-Grc3/P-loop containing nucleoside triphosphate hydrolase/Polyribonucleotide 5'-hydroxyl-kinase Clp1 [Babesia duncani]|uniref:Bifunctional Polyribonucleotide 5-hydroxyl-kinase Clp1-Grc3/P-loop containing nucleoside triphosphate hydrolase/Polyribonucleotide 5'-hydroxyl-kinase Clp1 n=1 Tax=Babesia duncani TaxID=323732 RepID=A0AAD9PPE9_9APIC|nr:bifunctional Polyribonucleotide 5-hydroxyl-kinase Clp1-Grc3/P-loop containing nucleoside triphosphate hydrolase/Polyribonucleotide 5'-hydroxyl-kinase Clp1 [Babesia duncani]
MVHPLVHVQGALLKSRCKTIDVEVSRIPETFNALDDLKRHQQHVGITLVGLNYGEYLTLSNAFYLKVIRGAVEINGHIYNQYMVDYRKFIIPPWNPNERLLALCLDNSECAANAHDTCLEDKLDTNNLYLEECLHCVNIMTNRLHGNGCCSISNDYLCAKSEIEKSINIVPHVCKSKFTNYTDFDKYLVDQYILKNNDLTNVVLALVDFKGVFGTVAVSSCINVQRPIKLIPQQYRIAAKCILDLCKSDAKQLPVLMIYGDKGAGKSTSVCYIVNYLLNYMQNIALLDCDIGQPLISAPGLMSLTFLSESITLPPHGNLSHIQPDHIGFVGEVSVRNAAVMLHHVSKFMDIYQDVLDSNFRIPLIINTFGWTSGLGLMIQDAIMALCNVAVKLVLVTKMNGLPTEPLKNHAELDERILYIFQNLPHQEDPCEVVIDTAPSYRKFLKELGVDAQYDTTKCRIIRTPSFSIINSQVKTVITDIMGSSAVLCGLHSWARVTMDSYSPKVSPSDIRWLRMCSYFNRSLGDAMHFIQLFPEEFFGPVESPHFNYYIRDPKLFKVPLQMELYIDKLNVVLPWIIPQDPMTLEQIATLACGSVASLCLGVANGQISHEISHRWEFLSFVYIHYFDTDSMSVLVSYPEYKNKTELARANIFVLCPTIGFDPLPPKLSSFTFYPSTESSRVVPNGDLAQVRRYSCSQGLPYRRNSLIHLVGPQGAGLLLYHMYNK